MFPQFCAKLVGSPQEKLSTINNAIPAIPTYTQLYKYLSFECIRKLAGKCKNHSNIFKRCLRKTIHMPIEDISFVHVAGRSTTALQAAGKSPRNCPNPPLLLSHLRVICGGVVRCWQLLSQRAVGLTSSQLHQVQTAPPPELGSKKFGEKSYKNH